MPLKEWIEKEGRKVEWLAGQLDCHPSTIWRWTTGRAKPAMVHRKAIERVTNRAVPVSVWK